MDNLIKFCLSYKNEQYLIVGDKEYDFIKNNADVLNRSCYKALIGRVNTTSMMDFGRMEMFFHEGRIKAGIRANSGKFYRIVGDDTLIEYKKPRQPKWFKEINERQ